MKIQDQIKCASRELAMRKGLYPKWVEEGRISKAVAEWEIEGMASILKTLNEIADKDQMKLFQ